MAPFGAGTLALFSTGSAPRKGSPFCTKGAPGRAVAAVLIGHAQRMSRAEPCVFPSAGVPWRRSTRCWCPALSCRSSARLPRGGDSAAQASALSQPSCCNTLTLDLMTSASCRSRGALSNEVRYLSLACRIRLENESLTIIFSRGCAPHPLSLKTRFSLYNIKVLQLLGNRLPAHPTTERL